MPLNTTSPDTTETSQRDAAVAWLLGRINYERSATVPYGERHLKLDRMRQLVTALGSPDQAAPIIHVAGTKGKGSTAAMIAAMLTAAGYRTGVFSSPHLERLEERLSVDGQPASGAQLAAVVHRVRPVVEDFDRRAMKSDESGLTFFDIITAVALVHFAEQQCGAIVLEVGLGGRLDSTNVCLPVVSVITSISIDHTKQLGDTLTSIAREKAGIIKPGVPVVSGVPVMSDVTGREPCEVIAQVAREHGCRVIQLGRDFEFDYPLLGYDLSLAGQHQAANAAVALAVVNELEQQGWSVDEPDRREGLANVRLPGRCELIPGRPKVVIDTAHNEASAAALAATLIEKFASPRTLVVACSTDKDIAAIAAQLAPVFDHLIVTRYLENPRAVPIDQLMEVFRKTLQDARFSECPTPREAWEKAKECTPANGVICIAGSFYLAAELRQVVLGERTC
ncbi:MAG: bifunctional folylpolyglutamate synthase/dihydrofolate synthase [Aeoliella sp.]